MTDTKPSVPCFRLRGNSGPHPVGPARTGEEPVGHVLGPTNISNVQSNLLGF